MNDLDKLSELVFHILNSKPETRNSDNLLYLEVLKVHGFNTNRNIVSMSVSYFLKNMALYACPKFESVRRARQKIQAKNPELKAVSEVELGRMKNVSDYKKFALNGGEH